MYKLKSWIINYKFLFIKYNCYAETKWIKDTNRFKKFWLCALLLENSLLREICATRSISSIQIFHFSSSPSFCSFVNRVIDKEAILQRENIEFLHISVKTINSPSTFEYKKG